MILHTNPAKKKKQVDQNHHYFQQQYQRRLTMGQEVGRFPSAFSDVNLCTHSWVFLTVSALKKETANVLVV